MQFVSSDQTTTERRRKPKAINSEFLKNAPMTRGIDEEHNHRLMEWFEDKSKQIDQRRLK